MKILLPVGIILIFFQGCGCKSECFSPPVPFTLEVVDLTTGENLIENGTIDTSTITLKATDTNASVAFTIEDNKITSEDIGWKSAEGSTEFELKLGTAGSVTITVIYEAISENCCAYYKLKGASFNREHEMISEYSYLIKM